MRSNGSGSSKILAALYCQIKFHKEILQSKGPKELFQKTVKNKSYTELELIQNLKQILTLNSVDKGTEKPKSLDLKPMQDIKTDIETIKKSVVSKIKSQREKRIVYQQMNLLPQYVTNPELLLKKKIKHKCFDENHTPQWYDAVVNVIDKKHDDPLKIKYEIQYVDTDEDELYSMNLLNDMKKGI